MGVFEDLGVMVDGLEDDRAEEFGGDVEEIFRFDVRITPKQEIEIGVNIAELEVDGFPEFGEQYGELAHAFADLVVQHVGMNTEIFMNKVADLQELDVKLTDSEQKIMMGEDTEENGAVLLYSFPVVVMAEEDEDDEKQLGAGFNRSPKADLMLKMYGREFIDAEEEYQDETTDAILEHGVLFMKAVDGITKL